jgi:hypothetical protein
MFFSHVSQVKIDAFTERGCKNSLIFKIHGVYIADQTVAREKSAKRAEQEEVHNSLAREKTRRTVDFNLNGLRNNDEAPCIYEYEGGAPASIR